MNFESQGIFWHYLLSLHLAHLIASPDIIFRNFWINAIGGGIYRVKNSCVTLFKVQLRLTWNIAECQLCPLSNKRSYKNCQLQNAITFERRLILIFCKKHLFPLVEIFQMSPTWIFWPGPPPIALNQKGVKRFEWNIQKTYFWSYFWINIIFKIPLANSSYCSMHWHLLRR